VTPFSSNTKYTGIGSQDILIVSVIFAGVSSTVGFTNLLITRRTLAMPGLRNRRVLLPFVTISLFLTMRMLALVTPVLAAAMIMLLMDRH
jgi:cytochrome c oxidase subunit 1